MVALVRRPRVASMLAWLESGGIVAAMDRPTIELRICDVCPRIDDAVCIAALYARLIRRLARLDAEGGLAPEPLTELIAEDRWIAQRYGVFAFFGDGGRVELENCVAGLVEALADNARALGCGAELGRALAIVREGTGANCQLDQYRLRRLEGDAEDDALRAVADLLLTRPSRRSASITWSGAGLHSA